MTDRITELRSESRDLLALLQRLGDGEHDDVSVAHDALAEIINLRLQRAALFDCAEALRDALGQYANPLNWSCDEQGIRRCWEEPGSSSPSAYNGFEAARAALAECPVWHTGARLSTRCQTI